MKTRAYEKRYEQLRTLIDRRLTALKSRGAPRELTEACNYVLSAGGKRVRSIIVLLSCEAVRGTLERALNAGVAVELMHSFTLVHDDIMDDASSRRGRPTVHVKWDANNALLVGDVLLGTAYKQLLKTRTPDIRRITELFTSGLLEVCEGQAFDLEMGKLDGATLGEYFRMIEKKTGRLISMSAELGAVIGKGTSPQINALRSFGHHLGKAFQLRDDLLDVVAEESNFGKSIGADIVGGKRTYLLLKAMERAAGRDRELLDDLLRMNHSPGNNGLLRPDKQRTIAEVTSVYERYGVIEEARRQIDRETHKATKALSLLPKNRATEMLSWFSEHLLTRMS